MMTTHAGFERLIATAVDFTLAPRERSELEEHLASCAACRSMADGYRADASALRGIAFVEPPPGIRVAVLAMASRPFALRIVPWKILLAAALLLATLVATTFAVGAVLRLVAVNADPLDWSAVPAGPALVDDNASLRLQGVASQAGRFVAVGSGPGGSIIVTSPDGQHWDRAGDPLTFSPTSSVDVFAADDGFVIVGSSSGNPAIWTSPDGVDWAADPFGDSLGTARAMAIGGGHTVVVGSRTVIEDPKGASLVGAAWSRDASGAWRQATITGTAQPVELRAVVRTGDQFLAVGGAAVLSSTDGALWRQVSAAFPIGASTLAVGGGRVIAAGLAGDVPSIWTSTDGVAWTRASLPPGATGRVLAVAYHDGSFVAVGSGPTGVAAWYSPDAASWIAARPIEKGTGGLMFDLAWGRDVVIGVGALGSRAAIWSGRESQP
jgi:anti-sigma factor RsiW